MSCKRQQDQPTSYWTVPVVSEPDSKASFDDYYLVKQERDRLKERLNHLDDDNRLLRTKCARLEESKRINDAGQIESSIGKPKEIHKIQQDYDDLHQCYSSLQRAHRILVAKHKSSLQVIERNKREIQSLNLRKQNGWQVKGGCRRKVLHVQSEEPTANKENVENALGQLKLRLSDAEEQLQILKTNPPNENGESKKEKSTAKLQLLQAQHEVDESRIKAQSEKLEKVLNLHQQYKARYGALKKELNYAVEEVETLECQVAQLQEKEQEVEELANQNLFLEGKVKKLCELTLPKEEVYTREKEMMAMQMQEKHRDCKLLQQENEDLRERNKQLHSQLSAEQYFARNHAPGSTLATASTSLGDVWQQLDHAQQQNQTFRSQLSINEAQQKQFKRNEHKLKKEIMLKEAKIGEISGKAVQRLQRIRLLESQVAPEENNRRTCLKSSSINLSVHHATLKGGLSEDTKSFVLVDFHTYGSELSNVAAGTSPAYDFTVTYQVEVDRFFSHLSAKGFFRIEVYVVQEDAAPQLFAYASVSTSALLHLPAAMHLPRLELLSEGDEGSVGSLSLSMRLQPTTPAPHSSPETIAKTRESGFGVASCMRRIVPDAISITIKSLKLFNNPSFSTDGRVPTESFYVNYRFLIHDAMTAARTADSQGVIKFQHKSTFPILSADDGNVEPVLLAISKSIIYFTLFLDSKRHHTVGEAQVPLSNIWGHTDLSTEIFLGANVVGSLSLAFDTAVRPVSSRMTQDVKQSAHSCFMTWLTEVMSTLGIKDQNETVNTARLLLFIDPPAGILETANLLQKQLITHFPGQPMSGILSFPPNNQDEINQSTFRRCSDGARKKLVLPGLPPHDELEDLHQYLSNNDGLASIRDMDLFLSSVPLKKIAAVCQELRRMKRVVRKDLQSMGGESSVKDLRDYIDKLFSGLSEGELMHLVPLLCDMPDAGP